MLLSKERAPSVLEGRRQLGAKDAARGRVAIRGMPAGDFIIPVILETAVWDGTESRIECCGRIATLRQNTSRLELRTAVILCDVEHVRGIKRLALGMEGVSRVFHENNLIF